MKYLKVTDKLLNEIDSENAKCVMGLNLVT